MQGVNRWMFRLKYILLLSRSWMFVGKALDIEYIITIERNAKKIG